MAIAFTNGKRVNLPSSATAADIVKASGSRAEASSRVVVRSTTRGNELLKPGSSYKVRPGDKFLVGPGRVKGSGETYFGRKEEWRKQVLLDQVQDLSKHFFKGGTVLVDEDCNWVRFSNFMLPDAWARANGGKRFVPILFIIPDQFPDLPTNGFYLPSYVKAPAIDRHFFDRGYGGAFGVDSEQQRALHVSGWKWYCTHVLPGSWRPARIQRVGDWRNGDNLWHVLTLTKEVLTNPAGD